MRDGVVLERGKHDELLSNTDGPYSRLVAAQNLRETREGIDMDRQSCSKIVDGDADIEEAALEETPLDRSKSRRSLISEILEQRKAQGPENCKTEYSMVHLFVRMANINKGQWKSYLFGSLFAIGEYSNLLNYLRFSLSFCSCWMHLSSICDHLVCVQRHYSSQLV